MRGKKKNFEKIQQNRNPKKNESSESNCFGGSHFVGSSGSHTSPVRLRLIRGVDQQPSKHSSKKAPQRCR